MLPIVINKLLTQNMAIKYLLKIVRMAAKPVQLLGISHHAQYVYFYTLHKILKVVLSVQKQIKNFSH